MTLSRAACLCGAYFFAAELGGLLSSPGSFATFWPPSGLLLAALLRTPTRQWPLVAAAVLPANLAFDLRHDHGLAVGLGYWSANCLEAVLGTWLVGRSVGRDIGLTRVMEVAALAGLAAGVSTTVGATLGAAIAMLSQGGPYWAQWRSWWLADLLGVLLVAPVVLTWQTRGEADRRDGRGWEWVVFLGAVGLATLLLGVRAQVLWDRLPGAPMVLFPLLGWGIWRFGPRGASVPLLAVAVVALWNHRLGRGVFDLHGDIAGSAMMLEAFFSVAAVTFLGMAAFVTELADMNRQLAAARAAAQEASRFKTEFVATMSHEVRTPLTAILGYADLLLDVEATPGDQRTWAENIRRCGDHLKGILNDALDLSKIEAGRLEIERITCSPVRLVEEVAAVMRGQATQKGLHFEVEYLEPLPAEIHTDPGRVRQILLNLLGNAVKFTSRGGVRIRIGMTDGSSNRLRVDVVDTGIGIPPDIQGRLGEPFVQGDASVGQRFGGTGLGLAIAKRLAHLLSGDLQVRSVPGEGSTFTLTLDAGPPAAGAAAGVHAPSSPAVLPSTAS